MQLLRSRLFLPLFLTQFFGAFNDNVFKLAMLTLISYHLSTSQANSEHYQSIAGILFTLPFFLFSATAGQLADAYDKAMLTRLVKIVEIILMLIGSIGLLKSNIPLMLFTLAGLGIHSTFFGPIKYAILPDHLPRPQLLKATGLIEASTFFAILTGTILGTLSIGNDKNHVHYAIYLINVASLSGFIASLFILSAPSSELNRTKIDYNIWRATINMLKRVLTNKQIYPAVLLISWFWLVGAVVVTKLPDYAHYVLRADTTVFAMFLGIFSIGIAAGSLAITKFLAGKITLRYVPLAMFFLSLFALDLYWISPIENPDLPLVNLWQFLMSLSHWRITIDFFLFSFCGGLFVVPLYTYLQVISKESQRAQTIAANNIYNALAMVLGGILVIVMLKLKFSIADVFLVIAILNIIVATVLNYIYKINRIASL
ncbi:2-acylglycerophosphoethanolamine acyltransferase [Legionella beliardensis]|uniref:2-acylglycerophosphoethanolamine acyltransferase n=1 Tax=Legionella beliardensis TaxID=91822 RepID=A0A378I1Y4_9GAMM|nr:MFS transporter [Legionella beliardensis]STX28730.1 2-acylglycerophosphoethanolamine acyltransferase [Legionella beliardensis]